MNGSSLTGLQVALLNRFFPHGPLDEGETAYVRNSKLEVLMGPNFFNRIANKTVLDFGCGEGGDAIDMVKHGAKQVIGVDIREEVLRAARQALTRECVWPYCNPERAKNCVSSRCNFAPGTEVPVDVVVSVDAFEHFSDPAEVLRTMYSLLRPGGEVLISFGYTWYHPLGGHLFSVFPWAHLIFSEKALVRWRSAFKTDGATRFGEVAGGLNQMTITGFLELVRNSPFHLSSLELIPIRKLRWLHNAWTREFTTSMVRCSLLKPSAA
jgi:SAM-dependent methyltransferase